jgi:hypothetical protein
MASPPRQTCDLHKLTSANNSRMALCCPRVIGIQFAHHQLILLVKRARAAHVLVGKEARYKQQSLQWFILFTTFAAINCCTCRTSIAVAAIRPSFCFTRQMHRSGKSTWPSSDFNRRLWLVLAARGDLASRSLSLTLTLATPLLLLAGAHQPIYIIYYMSVLGNKPTKLASQPPF